MVRCHSSFSAIFVSMKFYSVLLVCVCLLSCSDIPVPKASNSADLYLFPNPTNSTSYLSIYNSSELEFPFPIRVLNDVGEEIAADTVYHSGSNLGIADEEVGKYFVIVETPEKDIVLPLVKVSE